MLCNDKMRSICWDLDIFSGAEAGALIFVQMEARALDQTDPRQSQAALVTPVLGQVRKKIPTKSASSVPPATTLVATSDISHIQTQLQYDKNLRTELYNICNQVRK